MSARGRCLDVERKDVVYLLDVYAKNVRDALSQVELNAVRKLVRILEEES